MRSLKGRVVVCPSPSPVHEDIYVLTRNRPRLSPARPLWCRTRSAVVFAEGTDAVEMPAPVSPPPVSTIPRALEWELDFSSRPLLDERKKKVWELLVCDPERSFEYSQYFPNSKVNSAELKNAIQQLLSQDGAQLPRRVKFFRAQMKTIINRGLQEFDMPVVPSRRCYALTGTSRRRRMSRSECSSRLGWLRERLESVYPEDPRYAPNVKSLFTLDVGAPESLPDNLRGEAWDFVQLPLRTLMNETGDIERREIFGASLDLKRVGLDDLSMDMLIPGAIIISWCPAKRYALLWLRRFGLQPPC